ncbi:MAG: anaerobic ribonucleoside-triphosphate reductase activating protein [Dehalobacterium sp.]
MKQKNRPSASLRIAGIVPESVVDGPGIRYVVFVQGCPHRCIGCHNPETHDFHGGKVVHVSDLVHQIKGLPLIKGITISGGEPFCQGLACSILAHEVKCLGKNVVVYSGYTYEQLRVRAVEDPNIETLLSYTDILIDGPYLQEYRDLNLPFRGSTNQRLIELAAGM